MGRRYYVIKTLINLIIFGFALSFEGASPERMSLMVLLFASYTVWGILRPGMKKGGGFLYGADAALVLFLEYQSKYLINYFFHILYITSAVEAGISLDRKQGNIAAAILSAAALTKYIIAFGFDVSASMLSQFLFNIFALAFLTALINIAKLRQEERDNGRRLYRELAKAYRRLEELSSQKEKAAVLEERNRIARDMHDGLGHRLTSLIMQIEMGKELLEKEPDKTRGHLDKCADNARMALTETRLALRALGGIGKSAARAAGTEALDGAGDVRAAGEELASDISEGDLKDLVSAGIGGNVCQSPGAKGDRVIRMIREFSENTGVVISLDFTEHETKSALSENTEAGPRPGVREIKMRFLAGVETITSIEPGTERDAGSLSDGTFGRGSGGLFEKDNGFAGQGVFSFETFLSPVEHTTLFGVIREALTNAVRHGNATRIDIKACREGRELRFFIQNNGAAGKDFIEGFGLASMRQRLEKLGGGLNIDAAEGFMLTGGFKISGNSSSAFSMKKEKL